MDFFVQLEDVSNGERAAAFAELKRTINKMESMGIIEPHEITKDATLITLLYKGRKESPTFFTVQEDMIYIHHMLISDNHSYVKFSFQSKY